MLGSESTSAPWVLCDITSSIGKYFKENKSLSGMIFILTFAALDNLFNPLMFLGGKIIHYLDYSASPYITDTLSAIPGLPYSPRQLSPTPGCHYSFPAILLMLVDMCPTIFPNTYCLCPPRHPYVHPTGF